MSANWAIWFGYMPKTNPIAGKAYQTSLDRKIEDLKPGSACPAHTRNDFFSQKFDLNKRQKVKGQHKGQKQFGILIPQNTRGKILKKVYRIQSNSRLKFQKKNATAAAVALKPKPI